MYHALVSRPDLDGLQPARASDGCSKDEIPIHVGAARGKRVRFFRFDDFIRTTELQAGDKLRGGGKIGGNALDRPLLGPLLNEGDLLIGQAEFVGKSQLL